LHALLTPQPGSFYLGLFHEWARLRTGTRRRIALRFPHAGSAIQCRFRLASSGSGWNARFLVYGMSF